MIIHLNIEHLFIINMNIAYKTIPTLIPSTYLPEVSYNLYTMTPVYNGHHWDF